MTRKSRNQEDSPIKNATRHLSDQVPLGWTPSSYLAFRFQIEEDRVLNQNLLSHHV